ncbi:MAG: undecaprenyl/decaprenyl-phosphate alpha-N-acetylglucosaminyl 1-phosphate transferase [Clostridiales bacterium]|nr:undecaprenyl/decaprenyl-phosphate alpha-N-acetylglucosaminyl 1-phosphate transferase [Clostridiales bacterium]
MNIMFEYLITFVLAFIVAFSATPIVKKLAYKVGAVDVPKDNRRMHKKPMALMGGAAIITGFAVTLIFNLLTSYGIFTPGRELIGMIAGMIIITIEGVLDDTRTLNAKVKLAFQLAAAITVVVISGSKVSVFTNPFSITGYTTIPDFIAYPLTVIWIVGITNAINLIDGLDGLAAGVSSISALSLFFVTILGTNPDPAVTAYTALITISLAGSTLGFLPYNFNPAKIFMGETGAAFLGFTLGVISLQGTLKSYTAISIAIPLLVLGLPLFDTIFAFLRRMLSGKSFMEADRGHLHHRLIDMGLSHKQSVVVMYICSGALGLCAIVLADRGALSAIILLVAVSVFIIGGAKFMNDSGNTPDSNGDGQNDGGSGDEGQSADIVNAEEQKDDAGNGVGIDTGIGKGIGTGISNDSEDTNETHSSLPKEITEGS